MLGDTNRTAGSVLDCLEDIRQRAVFAAGTFKEDALGVDDLFLSFINPNVDAACWHPAEHSKMRQRGRPWTPNRRAATWGTYCLAWLTGSESVAVRLWNVYGGNMRWGTNNKKGIKVYGATKKRLVKSLVWAMGPAVTPPNSWARPYAPLLKGVLDEALGIISGPEPFACARQGIYARPPEERVL